jgi:hypothetical protein
MAVSLQTSAPKVAPAPTSSTISDDGWTEHHDGNILKGGAIMLGGLALSAGAGFAVLAGEEMIHLLDHLGGAEFGGGGWNYALPAAVLGVGAAISVYQGVKHIRGYDEGLQVRDLPVVGTSAGGGGGEPGAPVSADDF